MLVIKYLRNRHLTGPSIERDEIVELLPFKMQLCLTNLAAEFINEKVCYCWNQHKLADRGE
jgi:hypothetical protein